MQNWYAPKTSHIQYLKPQHLHFISESDQFVICVPLNSSHAIGWLLLLWSNCHKQGILSWALLSKYCYPILLKTFLSQSFDVNKALYTSSWYKTLNQEHCRYLITFILSTQQRNGFIVEGLFDFSFVSLNYVIICSKLKKIINSIGS